MFGIQRENLSIPAPRDSMPSNSPNACCAIRFRISRLVSLSAMVSIAVILTAYANVARSSDTVPQVPPVIDPQSQDLGVRFIYIADPPTDPEDPTHVPQVFVDEIPAQASVYFDQLSLLS